MLPPLPLRSTMTITTSIFHPKLRMLNNIAEVVDQLKSRSPNNQSISSPSSDRHLGVFSMDCYPLLPRLYPTSPSRDQPLNSVPCLLEATDDLAHFGVNLLMYGTWK